MGILIRQHLFLGGLLVLSLSSVSCRAGIPAPAQYYPFQLVDHNDASSEQYWTQRFYVYEDHFFGPGFPIFLILGGEGGISPDRGILYPTISHQMAPAFGAYVLQPEHRFYGASQPVSRQEIDDISRESGRDPRIDLLTTEQALKDAMRLVRHIQTNVLGCSTDPTSWEYCPVITVGGSYPGFMSAMARLRFPDVVDMAYAASAPMLFYAQKVPHRAYYQHIAQVADMMYPGCSSAVQTTLSQVYDTLLEHSDDYAETLLEPLGLCPGTLPAYIQGDVHEFWYELQMMVAYTLANNNMANYPPYSNATHLHQSCAMLASDTASASARLRMFLLHNLAASSVDLCVDVRTQLPTGRNPTVTGGDWSGDGTGADAESWDFQTCTLLVETIELEPALFGNPDNQRMIIRPWTLEWLQKHCANRFAGVVPRPTELVDAWRWLDFSQTSRIVFTNGLLDGWSVSGIVTNASRHDDNTIVALNFPNGAHHSDLAGHIPDPNYDTPDVWEGILTVQRLLEEWLDDLPHKNNKHDTGAADQRE